MGDKRRYHNKKPKADPYKPPFPDGVLNEPISNLSLREETYNLLIGAGINTVGDVVKRAETDFYRIMRFNKKNLLDVKAAVKKKNLFLKPTPEKNAENNPNSSPAKGSAESQEKKESNKRDDRRDARRDERHDKKGKDKEPPYVMKTLPEKPPRPVKVVVHEEHDRYVKINKNGLWGFRDRNSKEMAVPAVYDEVFNFKEDLCCVQKDEKFGFINRQGEEVIPLVYDCATSFSEGLACVFKGENCGYIDKNGETVIDFKFDAGTPVVDGECRVKRAGQWGELHIDNPKEIRWII